MFCGSNGCYFDGSKSSHAYYEGVLGEVEGEEYSLSAWLLMDSFANTGDSFFQIVSSTLSQENQNNEKLKLAKDTSTLISIC